MSRAAILFLVTIPALATACGSPQPTPASSAPSASAARPPGALAEPPSAEPPPVATTPSPDVLVRVVEPAYPKVKACYDKGLAKNPQLTGSVRYRLIVDTSGHVERADDFGSDLPDQEVRACIQSLLVSLTFPKHEQPYEVGVPFRLVPSSMLKGEKDGG